LFTVRGWKLGEGIVATNLMEEVRKHRISVLEVRERLREYLDQPLRQLSSKLLRLRFGIAKDTYLLNPKLYKSWKRPTNDKRESRFSHELIAKVLLAQDKAEYTWSDMTRISRGLRARRGLPPKPLGARVRVRPLEGLRRRELVDSNSS
jgi:hypothetical protein